MHWQDSGSGNVNCTHKRRHAHRGEPLRRRMGHNQNNALHRATLCASSEDIAELVRLNSITWSESHGANPTMTMKGNPYRMDSAKGRTNTAQMKANKGHYLCLFACSAAGIGNGSGPIPIVALIAMLLSKNSAEALISNKVGAETSAMSHSVAPTNRKRNSHVIFVSPQMLY